MGHQQQDKPGREDKQKSREIQRLKGLNRSLTKQLARAHKQLARYESAVDALADDPEPMVDGSIYEEQPLACENRACQAPDVVKIQAGPKAILVCRSCRWRKIENV